MEFIVPIGVIVYIVMAVLGALIQSMTSKDQPKKESSPEMVSVEPPQLEEESMDVNFDDDSTGEEDWDWDPPVVEKTTKARFPRRMVEPGRLAHAVIMSEVIREPRSKRPWPIR